jgi:2-polyprenyl-6-methoxyphenol hydroxylase-like FAD-dependent oxidoreductase
MTRTDVLIVGAGPTGLVLALWLTKLGVGVRIVDKAAEPATASRALAIQARTLELYRQLDLSEAVVARGHKTPAINLWVEGAPAARVALTDIGRGLSPYPFALIFPQDEHETLLSDRLAAAGILIERGTELLGFEDGPDHLQARLRMADGRQQTCRAAYLAGCDGAHSTVRHTLGTGFAGGNYRQLFYVADVEAEGPAIDGELHVDLDEADFLAVFPLARAGRVRLIGIVRDERAEHPERLTFEDVSDQAIDHLKVAVRRVNWFSSYRVHHRVASHFRAGRAFLLGDAAHIHSPAGGQGMNTGIGDAINLAWKLAAVVTGAASDSLLDSYEAERIGFARRLVATTDRGFALATAPGPMAEVVRTRLVPLAAAQAFKIKRMREFLFRTVGQLAVNYRGEWLSAGRAGRVRGGDRLPWVASEWGDNFVRLAAMVWQVHVYGAPSQALSAWCAGHGLALHVFDWRPEHARAGLARDALYLLRPDSYVALADPCGSPDALARYFADRAIAYAGGGGGKRSTSSDNPSP